MTWRGETGESRIDQAMFVSARVGHLRAAQDAGRIAPAREARLSGRLRRPRRQMKQRESRPADPGFSERNLVDQVCWP